jgi:putative addiction module component (TIGR02574 family)
MTNETLTQEVLALPEKERAQLAELLIESISPEPKFKDEEALAEEVKRRVNEFESGDGKAISGEQVISRLKKKYS